MNRNTRIICAAIGVYLVVTLISYFIFNKLPNVPGKTATTPVVAPKKLGDRVGFDASLPKTEECPINGVKYSTQQRAWWEKHRPLGVMIENSLDARPQSGISFADVTYEALAEGGITRTMNVFYCQDAGTVGPVRSARTYFLDYISEYGSFPLYAHVGGANIPGIADALGQIDQYGWSNYNNMDQFAIGFPVFWRDYDRLGHDVATEHTMYSATSKLWEYAAQKRGLSNVDKDGTVWDQGFVKYTFKDEVDSAKRPAAQTISFSFWPDDSSYDVEWDYNPKTNLYSRINGGRPHIDLDTKQQLTARNVVILFERESRANDGYTNNEHMIYGTKGTGRATIFMDGQQINATWSKATRTSRTILSDASGLPIKFTRGKIWFEIVSNTDQISVK